MRRRTLAGEARVRGRGLFTGADVVATVGPGEGGISFRVGGERVPAQIDRLSTAAVLPALADVPSRHTVLSAGGARAITTEHALAALVGLGVTDAEIVLEGGDELPIDDGSALAFVQSIEGAGLVELDGEVEPLRVSEVVTVEDGRGGMIVVEPLDGDAAQLPRYSYLLEYPGGEPALSKQTAAWAGDAASFVGEIAPARTFSFANEIAPMRAVGLFEGFSPRELLVLDERGEPIENELHFDDEPARHKLLDLIGDLALVGRPIIGRVSAYRSGHALNHEMARRLASLVS
ncbi:MAG: UDP-3-O-acyl-N-acetylglucosamine deacetylase [Planctomycetota bacterium]